MSSMLTGIQYIKKADIPALGKFLGYGELGSRIYERTGEKGERILTTVKEAKRRPYIAKEVSSSDLSFAFMNYEVKNYEKNIFLNITSPRAGLPGDRMTHILLEDISTGLKKGLGISICRDGSCYIDSWEGKLTGNKSQKVAKDSLRGICKKFFKV